MVDEEDVDKKKRKPRKVAITRTECKACIRVKLNEEGNFEVIQHVLHHNHELIRKPWQYLHKSQREITEEKAEYIEAMGTSGLRPMESFRYMCVEAGGEDCVGHTAIDHLNFCSRLRMKQIEAGDAQALIDILYQEQANDPGFYFRVKLNEEGRVCNLFWRDSMMLEDYKIYGDILVFDTTYRTNKYNLICAPFVGINNHWKNCMFGCSFIGNEKIESFV
ncbi:protein FAR1-RELATED SEQUENCE 5-like isoform X1 [Spinacia oleracea]|uniref:Protein FAR1-RELATED SEQUENCE 5-like isoform X1 n=1 Tax=Spinacia oleracea TaxID=3562 RepID=A0ABM3RL71_SPIOL|nr:protein FAR1-RELATED SEQUENCE 5-like isoform X1 [Spinacia oleracea]